MTTQADLFKKLQAGGNTGNGAPRPEFIKFTEQNVPIQGVVKEVYVGTEYNPDTRGPRLDKAGNPLPQVTLTLELEDGTLRRQGFAGDLLRKLSRALQDQGLEEVPIGALVGSAWTGWWQREVDGVKVGRQAREHVVKVKVG
jgi:hypothetical protein